MYVTPEIIAAAEASYGTPRRVEAAYEITPFELAMIRSSQRDGRAHDVTVFIFDGERLAVIAKPSYPPGAFRVPGGALRPGEAMHVGAAREAHEETGLEVRMERYLLRIHARFTVGDDGLDWTTHVVTARLDAAAPPPSVLAAPDSCEIKAARWSSLAELNGSIRAILLASGRPLFRYRADLHAWTGEQLGAGRPA